MPPLRLTVFLYFTVFHKGSISQAVKDRRLGLLLMIPVVIVVFIIMGLPFIRAITGVLRIRSLEQKQTLSDLITILSYSRIRFIGNL